MSLIDIVKHARPMKLKDGKRHVWPTLASMVYLADGTTPITDGNGNWNADKALDAEKLGGVAADKYALKTDIPDDNGGDADTLGGKSPEYYLQPRNLLDNSDFRNPVNQRSVTISENGFIVDRWYTFNDYSTGAATLNDSGITTTGDNYLQQRLPRGTIPTEYTLAVYYSDGTVDVGTNGYCAWGDEFDIINHVRSNGKTISHIALYEGSYTAETLPPYVPKPYSVELAACRYRYQEIDIPVWGNLAIGDAFIEGYFECTIPVGSMAPGNATITLPDHGLYINGGTPLNATVTKPFVYGSMMYLQIYDPQFIIGRHKIGCAESTAKITISREL